MQHGKVSRWLLFPTDENTPKTVHPTVRSLDNPTPRFVARLLLEGLGFFATRANVRREAELNKDGAHFIVVVALVQAHALRLLRCWLRTGNRDAFNRFAQQLEVVLVGSCGHNADGNARAFTEQAALGAAFAPVGGVLACAFPPQAALWSSRRPSKAKTSLCL